MMATKASLLLAASLVAFLALGAAPAAAQEPAEEVLCPIFIPESPLKYCIQILAPGCVHIRISTFMGPPAANVNENTCELP